MEMEMINKKLKEIFFLLSPVKSGIVVGWLVVKEKKLGKEKYVQKTSISGYVVLERQHSKTFDYSNIRIGNG
ncbi:hypothetical protein DERP_010741 [Dermatophagoides pteronyssinus]|uniref:Uncharacterized protein n=1 Tax=Dermatophagoides pteronyssinus TaxID=6956 RepID=A0ABQ8J6L6_DERPT|nr:hypothetical protein DERP_010741 [Dermatophagoides pteronyssinus]